MPFDFASLKANTRRVVHNTLGVSASYVDNSMSTPAPIIARLHNKVALYGDPENEGYAEMVEGVYRIVLIPSDTPDLNFKRGGKVKFANDDRTYVLDVLEPQAGPLERIWRANSQ